MGDVIKMKPPPGAELLYLPEPPYKNCAKCGRGISEEPHTWTSRKYGCGVCAPEMEEVVLELSGLASRVFLLEEAIRILRSKLPALGPSLERVLSDLKLEIPTDE